MTLIRSFVAVDIDNVEIVRKIEHIQREFQKLGLDAKVVEKENLHITLRFLGEVPIEKVEQIAKSLSTLRYNKFEIQLSGLGVFPDVSKPRVLWIGVAKGREDLIKLAELVRGLVDKYAAHIEEREFTPHLTIARIKSGRGVNKLQDFIKQNTSIEIGTVIIDKVKLKKSVLTPRGPIYSDIFVQNLM